MTLGESDTRAKLIDPAIHARGWTEDLIRREETAGTVEILDGVPRRRARGRVDYVLRVKVNAEAQPVAVALLEAKAEHLPPTQGLPRRRAAVQPRRCSGGAIGGASPEPQVAGTLRPVLWRWSAALISACLNGCRSCSRSPW